MKPFATFRLYPGRQTPLRYRLNQRRYFTIRCYRTKEEMNEARRAMRPHDGDCIPFAAAVLPEVTYTYRKVGKRKRWVPKNPSLGYAIFHQERVGAGLLAHESLHIALCFLRAQHGLRFRLAGEECDETEEELAYVLTTVVRQITIGFIKRKVY